ncbi:glucose-6-phosphate isomerase family protein [Parasphaerochaeta coccoides]|uniref:glucose-6-phosphate isomerase n=1 Tax=Parasphaerochaeta coccoides (strain ATCC BAA-1237 / DSM 17374 / SPN1) TaxID=760011 RepID=F4GI93_PARC1|nr:glucose-6-phosphate isomerase family protein [Parasphaerochaeta coccoides]AEC01252.1 glucose-6-phosphate isomerase [Parasphaerochaeta coccoides DSM 17374]
MTPKTTFFDLQTGFAPETESVSLKRSLSTIKSIFSNQEKAEEILSSEDRLVYEFYDLGIPEKEGNIAYGTSILYPGKVGDEFHMTKGHFHTILDTGEVYYCLKGHGMMMMENPEGDVEYREMRAGHSVFVPGRYAHRTINVSDTEVFVTFFAFRADAGHDYGTVESKGFRKLVVSDGQGGYKIIDNPKWNSI